MKKKTSNYKKYYAKMLDYRRFSVTLICISVFLYFGTMISISRDDLYTSFLLLFTILGLCAAAVFFALSASYQRKSIQEEEETHY